MYSALNTSAIAAQIGESLYVLHYDMYLSQLLKTLILSNCLKTSAFIFSNTHLVSFKITILIFIISSALVGCLILQITSLQHY